jgi:LPXTG-site transpeptidase (sortase) family protein
MKVLTQLALILAGLGLLILALAQAAPDLALAVAGEGVFLGYAEPAPPAALPGPAVEEPAAAGRTDLPGLVVEEPLAGLSPSFSAYLVPFPPEAGSPDLPSELEDGPAQLLDLDGLAGVEYSPGSKVLERREVVEGDARGGVPVRLVIPAISLDAPIIPGRLALTRLAGREFHQWVAPEEAAVGWHTDSALLGEPGNTILNGHHNEHGEVFRRLVDLSEGDFIYLHSEERVYTYVVANRMILAEKYQPLKERMENARWIAPSADERLTLVTCWPYESNTHRLILVASPLP